MPIIAIKPNNVKKEHLNLDQEAGDIPEFINTQIQNDLFKTPIQKYPYPMTSSQTIGWEDAKGLNTGGRRGKPTCDVTSYANEYVRCMGRSPYATKDLKKDGKQDGN